MTSGDEIVKSAAIESKAAKPALCCEIIWDTEREHLSKILNMLLPLLPDCSVSF